MERSTSDSNALSPSTSQRRHPQTPAVPLLLGAVLGGNVLTMSLANFFELDAVILPWLYLACSALVLVLIYLSKVTFPTLGSRDHIACLLFGIVLSLPRLPYLLEGYLGYAVNAAHDDWYHIQYVAAIVDCPRFPPRSTFDNSQFFSYYYAPWMLGAALRLSGVASTVKQALALSDLLYATLTAYFTLYATRVLFHEIRLRRIFLFLCVLYGGFDFLYYLLGMKFDLQHAEWWAADFGVGVQFSNFFTLMLWVPQHVVSAMATLYGLYLASHTNSVPARIAAGILFASAIFSSPFVVFGTLPLGIFLVSKHRNLLGAVPISAAVLLLLASPLVWIFLEKDSAGFQYGLEWFGELDPFFQPHKRAAFFVFLAVVLLELGPLFVASYVAAKRNLPSRMLVIGAALYLLSTFFIHYFGSNYCMRGAVIPIFTLIYVAAAGFDTLLKVPAYRWYQVALIPYFLGGLYEYASFSASSIQAFRTSNTPFNVSALASNASGAAFVDPRLLEGAEEHQERWYLLEKRKAEVKDPLSFADAATFHGDNRYRLTWNSIIHGRNRLDVSGTSPQIHSE